MTPLRVVCRKLAARSPATYRAAEHGDPASYWPPDSFRLSALDFWRSVNDEARRQLLGQCAADLLREALGIERTAMDYCARRVLAADDPIEQQVYSLMAAEEARHYHWLCSLADEATVAAPPDEFSRFLARLVREATPHSQSYLLQIVLEGWGIAHYQRLAAHSRDAAVTRVMAAIARDEGLHYAAGVAHFNARRLSAPERALIREALAELCTMLACGPLAVLRAAEAAAGGFSADERLRAFATLTDDAATSLRLRRLARYVARGDMAAEAAWLAERCLLAPLPVQAGLRLYAAP